LCKNRIIVFEKGKGDIRLGFEVLIIIFIIVFFSMILGFFIGRHYSDYTYYHKYITVKEHIDNWNLNEISKYRD